MLTDLQIEEMQSDLIDLEEMIEQCPLSDTPTLRDLSHKKQILLQRLWRWLPFNFNR